MLDESNLFAACLRLFTNYPLALMPSSGGGNRASAMNVVVADGNEITVYTITHRADRRPAFVSVEPWHSTNPDSAVVQANDTTNNPGLVRKVLRGGIPFPAHRSLFGWVDKRTVTALVKISAEPAAPYPTFLIMPRGDANRRSWVELSGHSTFGAWFWGYCVTGRLVPLAQPIAATRQTVEWVTPPSGATYCRVRKAIRLADGNTFPQGIYMNQRDLGNVPLPAVNNVPRGSTVEDVGTYF